MTRVTLLKMKNILIPGLVAGVAMNVVNMLIVNPVFSKLYPSFQGIYENTTIFKSMDDPVMSLFFVYPVALAIALALVWDKTKHMFAGDMWRRGLHFGLVYFAVAGIPAFLINFASFNLPAMMVVSWTVMTLTNGLVAGWVFAKMNS